jgi:hypothetical protein
MSKKRSILLNIFLLLLFLPYAHAQFDEIEKRLKNIQDSSKQSSLIIDNISSLNEKASSFRDKNLIPEDIKELTAIKTKLQELQNQINLKTESIASFDIKRKLAELNSVNDKRSEYLNNEKKLLKLSNSPNYSERLNKFIKLINDRKYNLSKAAFYTLNKNEQEIAKDYEDTSDYLLAYEGVQQGLEKDINKIKGEIGENLSIPEREIKEIQELGDEVSKQEMAFYNLQKKLDVDQFELKLNDSWKLGGFRCEKDAHYFRLDRFPNLLFLKNETNLTSVIELDPLQPKEFKTLYSCKKQGKFGGCLDNKNKVLCSLDSECNQVLKASEISYQRNIFFNDMKDELPAKITTDLGKLFQGNDPLNSLTIYEEYKKLGYYSKPELGQMLMPMIEVMKSISAQTPEEYLSKIKIEIEKQKKLMTGQISKKAGAQPDKKKVADSEIIISYVFTSLQSELENLLQDDFLQDSMTSKCSRRAIAYEDFCRNSKLWREKVTELNKGIEVFNLIPKEQCNERAVFRFPKSDNQSLENNCESDLLNGLEKSMQEIQSKIGN